MHDNREQSWHPPTSSFPPDHFQCTRSQPSYCTDNTPIPFPFTLRQTTSLLSVALRRGNTVQLVTTILPSWQTDYHFSITAATQLHQITTNSVVFFLSCSHGRFSLTDRVQCFNIHSGHHTLQQTRLHCPEADLSHHSRKSRWNAEHVTSTFILKQHKTCSPREFGFRS